MHKLRHFYYQNKEKIWKVVLIIAFLLAIIYYINNSIIEKESNPQNEVATKQNIIYEDNLNNTYISDKTAISGSSVTETDVKKINNTISKFLKYCKNENIEEAYKMLSEDCKKNKYDTLEKFKNEYVKEKFKKDYIYEIQKWIQNTYKISISEDILSTGNIKDNKREIEYITIVNENSEEKLNINSYIGKKEINKQVIQDDIRITVISKKTYMDYEIYDFKIENKSNRTINIDSLEKTGTMYLKDSNGFKYNAYAHEIFEEDLEIKSNQQFNVSIKYANAYSDSREIEQIVFENIILDYIKYSKTEDKSNFGEIMELRIDL